MSGTTWSAVRASPDVVASDLIDGGVLFDLNSKQYYAVNASGLYAWKVIEAGGDLAAVEARVAGASAPGRGDDPSGLRAFVSSLRELGVAEPGSAAGDGALASPEPPESWTAPTVEAHGNPLAEVILSPFDPTVPIPE